MVCNSVFVVVGDGVCFFLWLVMVCFFVVGDGVLFVVVYDGVCLLWLVMLGVLL